MGHIKEPKGVDFIINSGPMTKEKEALVSNYIKTYKAKNAAKLTRSQNAKSKTKIVA
jgi:hypothetical protein